MFVTVRHGDDEKAIMNGECQIRLFTAHLKAKCCIAPDVLVDLCDENGELQKIYDKGAAIFVSKFLEDRKTYIPVIIYKSVGGRIEQIIPCLTEVEDYYPNLKRQLEDERKSDGMKMSRDKFKKWTKRSTTVMAMSKVSGGLKTGKKRGGGTPSPQNVKDSDK